MSITFPEQFNMAEYFLDSNIEKGRGERTAIYDRDRAYSYIEIQELANRVGNALLNLGVEMEDRVLIVLPDSVEFVAVWFGIAKIGAIITMVNTLLHPADYEYYLDYTRAKVAVVDSSVLERFLPAASKSRYLRNILAVGAVAGTGIVSYEESLAKASDSLENAPTNKDDIAIWLFTSGSTGRPKAAVHLQHDLPYNTECYAKQVLRINENDITLSVPKLFFGYATGTNLLFPFAVGGASALFAERSTAETMFEMIQR
ncbi:MAG TPA: AMP-binding protein, partial [Blastocatellia bacterium]|nr:AMP-binding protein [Blastocatellia bacterium]